jgi:hypothetical protein
MKSKPAFNGTVTFTRAEARRIEQAAKTCGWKAHETGRFVRQVLLAYVTHIFPAAGANRRKPAARLPRR